MAIPEQVKKTRKEIRKKIAEILKDKTDAGSSVFPNASIPTWHEELPVILIYPKSEPIDKYAQAPRELERNLDLQIEIQATGPEVDEEGNEPINKKSLEDILDDIVEQIECEMAKDDTLQSTADDSILTNVEFDFDSAGSQPIGSARLTYNVTYYTMSPESVDKQVVLDDFKKSEIEYNIGDDLATREAKDSVDLPQS